MSKLPTEPGFYWWRWANEPEHTWEPCRVFRVRHDSELSFQIIGDHTVVSVAGETRIEWGGPVSAPTYFERLLWSACRLFPDANSIYIQYSDNDESSLQEVEAYCIVRSVPHEPMTVYLSAPTIEQLETEIQRRVQNAS